VAVAKFTPPEHWEDWISLVLGIWLCGSPWVLGYASDVMTTQYAFGFGIALIALELWTVTVFHMWEEWINVILGALIVLFPWLVSGVAAAARVNFVIVGLVVLALALYEIWDVRRHSPHSA